ncbi:MAG: glycosyltransferase family 2 protein, partial [Candidatus Marinimicrobia bacterium]|nr:glycosyltransferase family 2 protein [Candidatus Neomarinimicrobiota bacterium]
MEISVVIPFLNEEETLPILHEKLVHQLDEIGKPWEIIYVNDGSSDNSFSVISEICKQSEKARVVGFRRNRGKSEALNCGFAEANGEFIITMDADLQDDPNEIPNLLTEIEKGFDMVSGWKENRKDPLEKRFASKIFNKVTQWSTGLKIHDFNCGLKIYRKEVVKTLKIYGSLHRFIPAMAHQAGFKVGEIPVKHY